MLLVLLLAPLLTGFVRKMKARWCVARSGGPFKPYRDLLRLSEGRVLADTASLLFAGRPM